MDSALRKAPLWLETLILLTVAIVLALIIKTLFVQAFYIPSSSMRPGLVINDRILVQKISYWFGGEPQRGDVVVFEDPGGWLPGGAAGPANPITKTLSAIGLYPTGGHLVKRVIGTEGDVIVCCDDAGRITVNGTAIAGDGFLATARSCDGPMGPKGCKGWEAGPVPEGQLFVMGDNRSASSDSSAQRPFPKASYVPEELVVGKVFTLVWPLSHFDWITRPDAFDEVADADAG